MTLLKLPAQGPRQAPCGQASTQTDPLLPRPPLSTADFDSHPPSLPGALTHWWPPSARAASRPSVSRDPLELGTPKCPPAVGLRPGHPVARSFSSGLRPGPRSLQHVPHRPLISPPPTHCWSPHPCTQPSPLPAACAEQVTSPAAREETGLENGRPGPEVSLPDSGCTA